MKFKSIMASAVVVSQIAATAFATVSKPSPAQQLADIQASSTATQAIYNRISNVEAKKNHLLRFKFPVEVIATMVGVTASYLLFRDTFNTRPVGERAGAVYKWEAKLDKTLKGEALKYQPLPEAATAAEKRAWTEGFLIGLKNSGKFLGKTGVVIGEIALPIIAGTVVAATVTVGVLATGDGYELAFRNEAERDQLADQLAGLGQTYAEATDDILSGIAMHSKSVRQ